jgi:chromosome segregation ATPase
MQPTDLTIEILKGIRDEVRTTNTRIEALRTDTNARFGEINARFDEANGRLDGTNQGLDRLERRQTETEARLATEIVAVVSAVHEVRDLLREDRALRDKVDDHERRIAAIETRAG